MISLQKMSDEEYTKYRLICISELAKGCVESGLWKDTSIDKAMEKATLEQDKVLPKGVNTPGHFLYTIIEDKTVTDIGAIWFGIIKRDQEEVGFIFDIYIEKAYRGKGFGSIALSLIEDVAKKAGLRKMQLHVFSNNIIARHLYNKNGYTKISGNDISELLQKEISL